MMTTTLERLRTLRLGAMADAYLAQQQDTAATAALGFDERFSMLVDAEHLYRGNRALSRRLAEAKLRLPHACLEDVDHTGRRGLDRALVRQLATGRWIAEQHNVLITGPTGVGKTYLACALGQQACRQGYRATYRRVPRLFDELALARADGSYATLLARWARLDVLILDDWGLAASVRRGGWQKCLGRNIQPSNPARPRGGGVCACTRSARRRRSARPQLVVREQH